MDMMNNEELISGIKIALGLYAANEGLEYSYDKDKNNKKLNVIWKDFQKYLMQHFHIPKYRFKALKWRKKIVPLKNAAEQLEVEWIRKKGRLEKNNKN